ncbi:hypothetical protein HN451_10170, partial [archaeon]|nr:hypothetical protein [archaeon]
NEIKNIDPKLIELKYDIDRFYKQAPNILKNYRILITPDLEELLDGTQKILDVYKSEFLCYFPISYLEKMKKAMINLKKIKNPSIYDLFKIFEDKDISFENIALVMAHPISVDASPMGRLAYILTSRKMNQRLTNVSHFIPEIAKRINGIESVNAGHDINTNLITRDYIIGENGQKNFFSGLGKSMTGNSDSHDKNWVFAGYSIIGIKEKTANDVIKSIQNGYVPSHGWGLSYVQDFAENRFGSQNKKLKWKDYLYNNKPLLQWSMLSPFSPDFVANYIGSKIKEEIIIPTKMAVIENIEKGNTPAPFCDYTK